MDEDRADLASKLEQSLPSFARISHFYEDWDREYTLNSLYYMIEL